MSRERSKVPPTRPLKASHRTRLRVGMAALAVVLLGMAAAMSGILRSTDARQPEKQPGPTSAPGHDDRAVSQVIAPGSLAELLALAPHELETVDIARMNLLSAEGLPGSETLDIESTLRTLDIWAGKVATETARYEPRFIRNPAEYNNSRADFCMLALITVLQLDLGVHYNEARVSNPSFDDSRDQFIHGMVGCDNGGTCVSMPVLYMAIGRRLGYPLRLVQAKEHVFVRWDDPAGERLNIEGAGRGMNTYPDSHYRKWPKPIADEEVARGEYLKSLSPSEELAVFLAARGHCFAENERYAEALTAFREAARRLPTPDYEGFVKTTEAFIAAQVPRFEADGRRRPAREVRRGP